jgi:hypothetical protein
MGKQAKAIAGAIAGFIAPGAALLIANGGTMSGKDWLVAAATCVVTYAAVYAAPKNAE